MNKKLILIIVGIVIVALILVGVFALNSSDGDDISTIEENVEAVVDTEENDVDQVIDTEDNEEVSIDDPVARLEASIESGSAIAKALDKNLTDALAAGCGNNLEDFNQKVVDLVQDVEVLHSNAESIGQQFQSIDPSTVNSEDQARIKASMEEFTALVMSSDDKHEQLASLSGTCNAS